MLNKAVHELHVERLSCCPILNFFPAKEARGVRSSSPVQNVKPYLLLDAHASENDFVKSYLTSLRSLDAPLVNMVIGTRPSATDAVVTPQTSSIHHLSIADRTETLYQ